jgi:hypothetical protein
MKTISKRMMVMKGCRGSAKRAVTMAHGLHRGGNRPQANIRKETDAQCLIFIRHELIIHVYINNLGRN